MSQLSGIIESRKRALISLWARNPLVLVQVESPGVLPGLVFLDDGGINASVGQMGRRAMTNCAVVKGAGPKDSDWSAWVAANYSSYRSAYLAFIRETYGIAAQSADLAGYDVDHLLNRARSPQDSTFIRIEAVPSIANQEWGRLFEKAASNPQFYANQNRKRRTMNWSICAKLGGQLPPTGPNDSAGIARLTAYFQTIGLNEMEKARVATDLQEMMDFAYKFR